MPACTGLTGVIYAAVGDGKMHLATGLNSLALLDWRGYCGYRGGSGGRRAGGWGQGSFHGEVGSFPVGGWLEG